MMQIISGSAGVQKQTHKTKALNSTEYKNLLTINEQIINDKARTNIDGDLTWIAIDVDDLAPDLGFPMFSYRDLLRTVYKSFDDSKESNIDLNSKKVDFGLTVLLKLNLLESPARKDVIQMGVKL